MHLRAVWNKSPSILGSSWILKPSVSEALSVSYAKCVHNCLGYDPKDMCSFFVKRVHEGMRHAEQYNFQKLRMSVFLKEPPQLGPNLKQIFILAFVFEKSPSVI